jgi:hypothetical protein
MSLSEDHFDRYNFYKKMQYKIAESNDDLQWDDDTLPTKHMVLTEVKKR